jgi:hypothetical protein
MRDDRHHDAVLEDAAALEVAYRSDGGASLVQAQSAILPADAAAAWAVTASAAAGNWEELALQALLVSGHLRDGTHLLAEAQEARRLMGYHLLVGLTALLAFEARFSPDNGAAGVHPPDSATGRLH